MAALPTPVPAGNLFTLCPVAPFGARYPGSLIQALLEGSQSDEPGSQTAESWLQHAFPGFYPHSEESLLQQRRSVAPHSLEDCTPALQVRKAPSPSFPFPQHTPPAPPPQPSNYCENGHRDPQSRPLI